MKAKCALLIILALPCSCMAASRSQPEPVEAGMQEAQLCKPAEIEAVADFLKLSALTLKSDDGEPRDSILVTAACKVNPASPKQTIIAAAYDTGQEYAKSLTIVLLDNVHQRVVADYEGEIEEDPMMSVETGSLWIDTANYALAKDVRAFAVDEISGYRSGCRDGGVGTVRYLYVRDGLRIRPVLSNLAMSRWQFITRGDDLCNSFADPGAPAIIAYTDLSFVVAPTASHGYRDLLVAAKFSRDDGKRVRNYFNNSACGLSFDHLLHFNGKTYPTEGLETELGCGDRFQPLAIVLNTLTAAPASAKAASAHFLPSMEVRILDGRDGEFLVQRVGEPGRLGWVPRAAIAKPGVFKPLHTWKGQATLHVLVETFGALGTLTFQLDGSYAFDFPKLHGSALAGRHFSGHLSTHEAVIEASNGPEGAMYFWRRADGTVCTINSAGNCGNP